MIFCGAVLSSTKMPILSANSFWALNVFGISNLASVESIGRMRSKAIALDFHTEQLLDSLSVFMEGTPGKWLSIVEVAGFPILGNLFESHRFAS